MEDNVKKELQSRFWKTNKSLKGKKRRPESWLDEFSWILQELSIEWYREEAEKKI